MQLKSNTTHLVVRSKRDRGFRRAGLAFTAARQLVSVELIGTEAAKAILAETDMLVVKQLDKRGADEYRAELAKVKTPERDEPAAGDYITVELRGKVERVDAEMVLALISANERGAKENAELNERVDALTKELQLAQEKLAALRTPPSQKPKEGESESEPKGKGKSSK